MTALRNVIVGGMLGALLLALAGLALLNLGRGAASAAPAGAATPVVQKAGQADEGQLVAAAVARFAARLGKDEASVNAVFVGAVGETVDQAVRDGTLSQARAAEIKDSAAKLGLAGVLLQGARIGQGEKAPGPMDDIARAMFEAAATALGVTPGQVKRDGASIAEVAKTRDVDLQRIKEAMLAAGKAKLAEAEQRGEVSPDVAADIEANLPAIAKKLIGAGRDPREPAAEVDRAVWAAAAATLGIDPGQMKQAVGGGTSIAELAQAKGIPAQRLKGAMLTAGKTRLKALVQQGKLTQPQADEQERSLPALIDTFIASTPQKATSAPGAEARQ